MSDSANSWTIAYKAPLSLGFSRQEYRSGLPCPPPGYFPDPGIEPVSLMSLAMSGRFFTTGSTWEVQSLTSGSFNFDIGITASSLKREKGREQERQKKRNPQGIPLPLEGPSSVAAERHPHRMGKNIPCAVPRQSHRDRNHILTPGTAS